MTTRREREEALLEDMLHYQRDHRPLLVRLVELDTFQEVNATPDRASLLELALRQLNRSIHPSKDMAPFLLALLARTAQPFHPQTPLSVAQQALIAQQDRVFDALLDHPAAPDRALWHSARWAPAKRTHPSDWTWPVALVRLFPTHVHPSLGRLFQEGWSPEAQPPGVSWLGHARAIHLPLARQWAHRPTLMDRALWAQRFAQADLAQVDLDQFTIQWGQAETDLTASMLPQQTAEEMLLNLLKAGPTSSLRTQLEALSTPDAPWTQLKVKDRGPDNKQTLWTPVGWILLQILRTDSSDWRAKGRSWSVWDKAMDLARHVVVDREAAPGVTEGGLCQLLGQHGVPSPAPAVQMLEWAIAATESFFCKGEHGHKEAPALPGAATRQLVYAWRNLNAQRYSLQPSAGALQWAQWWDRLFTLGLGVPDTDYREANQQQEALVQTLGRLSQSAEVPLAFRQGLILNALATGKFATEPSVRLAAQFMSLAAQGWALPEGHPGVKGCLAMGPKSPQLQGLVAYVTSHHRHTALAHRPAEVSPSARSRRRT